MTFTHRGHRCHRFLPHPVLFLAFFPLILFYSTSANISSVITSIEKLNLDIDTGDETQGSNTADPSAFVSKEEEEMIRQMDENSLKSLLDTLNSHKGELDRQIEALLKEEDEVIENKQRVLLSIETAKSKLVWEKGQKLEVDKQLELLQGDIETKQNSLKELNEKMIKLKGENEVMEKKLLALHSEKDKIESIYYQPTLTNVIKEQSESWSALPQNIFNRTMNKVVPSAEDSLSSIYIYHKQVKENAPVVAVLMVAVLILGIAFTVIGFAIILIRQWKSFTIGRILALGDLVSAVFWFSMSSWTLLLWKDPLEFIKSLNETVSFLLQIAILTSYIAFALLRMLIVALNPKIWEISELWLVIIAGHHYFVQIWKPFMLGHYFKSSSIIYFMYGLVFGSLAVFRIEHFTGKPFRESLLFLMKLIRHVQGGGTLEKASHDDNSDSEESDSDDESI